MLPNHAVWRPGASSQKRQRPTPMHFCPQISYHHRTRRPRNPQQGDVLHGANGNILARAPPWHGTERYTPLWVESNPPGAVDKTFNIPSPHSPFSSPSPVLQISRTLHLSAALTLSNPIQEPVLYQVVEPLFYILLLTSVLSYSTRRTRCGFYLWPDGPGKGPALVSVGSPSLWCY
ncbi:hypothetical protein ASPSYDRAFT_438106 [Aspergillus sydowii CBS 593.65]|uniref:Uncharacterized protein n=1 Tax=Aspergillus sydowii CBS 593.65 TaxID=1036612 RepID=A0A1L9T6C9_9EURO|nr:uncharacterized protein ASPSYDRAFT_438106 [Aspergillus sydowii CBS 593.65]OJJ55002.1 hypothetical protein ASPSYDRAFT_438106 [Aspergillus sydowii CBS 593.65]